MRRASTLLALLLTLVAPAAAAAPWSIEENPWIDRNGPGLPMHIAHQGGEHDYPSATMFALKQAAYVERTDMLEIDVHATADGEIVVLHDATVDRTTNGSGAVDSMTLADIKALDAAYNFVQGRNAVPNCGTCTYPYRGVRTGTMDPPGGYSADDFSIPTLREVLVEFPDTPINIEIKNTFPTAAGYERTLAELLAEFGRTDDAIVVSFLDNATETFKLYAPDVHTAVGTAGAAIFKASSMSRLPGAPNPRYQALQVPMVFNGVEVVTEEFVSDAHENGLAVHVWTIDDVPTMCQLIDWGVDGIMSAESRLLRRVLDDPQAHCHTPAG